MEKLKDYKVLIFITILAYIPMIFLPYIGEEANWVIPSFEMAYYKNYLLQTIYNTPYYRPPLFNYPMILWGKLFGWSFIKEIERLETITLTVLTSFTIFFVIKRIFKDKNMAYFGALLYLTMGDVMIHDGWLGYEDGVYIGFSAISMLITILGFYEESYLFIFLGSFFSSLAFFTKALTGFVYFFVTLIISFYVLKPKNISFFKALLLSILLPLVSVFSWYGFAPKSNVSEHGMLFDIINKFRPKGVLDYLKQFFGYPIQFLLNMALWSVISLYILIKNKALIKDFLENKVLLAIFLVGFINFIPYWLPPQSGIRYSAPLYSIFALLFTYIIYPRYKDIGLKVALFSIGVKYLMALVIFPIYYGHIRENTTAIAKEVYEITKNKPLYSDDYGWVGFSVIAQIDIKRGYPVIYPPKNFKGCVFTANKDKYKGKVIKNYENSDYLICN